MPRIFLNSEITFLLNSVQQVIYLLFKIFTLLIKILVRYQTSDSNDSFVESEEAEEEEDCEPHCRCRACSEVERKRILLRHHRKNHFLHWWKLVLVPLSRKQKKKVTPKRFQVWNGTPICETCKWALSY